MLDNVDIWYSQRKPHFEIVVTGIAEELSQLFRDSSIPCMTEPQLATLEILKSELLDNAVFSSVIDGLIRIEVRLPEIDLIETVEHLIDQLHTVHCAAWLPQSTNGNPVKELTCVIPPQVMPEGWRDLSDIPSHYRIQLTLMDARETKEFVTFSSNVGSSSSQAEKTGIEPIDLLFSGGGYRATVFHLGVLRFLYEHSMSTEGPSAICAIRRIIGISGGSITASDLAFRMSEYKAHFTHASTSIRKFVTTTDGRREVLIKGKTLSQVLEEILPDQADFSSIRSQPELFILGTNYQSGGIFSFSSRGLQHFKQSQALGGMLVKEEILSSLNMKVRHAVAASAAFPPFLPPVSISPELFSVAPKAETLNPIRNHEIGDGGIRDNLGAEFYANAFDMTEEKRTCIVSDAGLVFDWSSKGQESQDLTSWINRLLRVTDIQMNRLWGMDLQKLRNVHIVSLADWERAEANESFALQAFNQPLTKGTARLAAQCSTDLIPLTDAEFYAILRLGYDAAERSLKDRLNLVHRSDSQIPDGTFWSDVFPKQIVKLNKQTNRDGMSLESALQASAKPKVRDANEAIEHLPLSVKERVLLKQLAWGRSHTKMLIAITLLMVSAIFLAGFLIGKLFS